MIQFIRVSIEWIILIAILWDTVITIVLLRMLLKVKDRLILLEGQHDKPK